MKKKIINIMLIAIMVIGLTGCGSRLATMVAMNYDLVNRYYNNKVTRVDLDVIARFCYVLNCELDEILTYKKEY